MHVADTSFLIAVFDSSDPRQAKAREELETASPVVIPTEILVETLGVLKVKASRRAATLALERLLRLPNVAWSECCDFQGTFAIYRSNPALSFPDAVVVRECITRRVPPLTFDQRQRDAVTKA